MFDDLGEITRRHFKDLQTLARQRRTEEVGEATISEHQTQYKIHQGNFHGKQQTQQPSNYYQTGPVQQNQTMPSYSGHYHSGRIY